MLFNSFQFIFFYCIVTLFYFLVPKNIKWLILFLASCYFYMAFVPVYILILFSIILIDYWVGIQLESQENPDKKKWLLGLSLTANIGILFFFKYFNFFNTNLDLVLAKFHVSPWFPYLKILLPIGLSFHTFQAMSYTIEVYKGNQKAERNLGIYSLYVMFYPQLVAGPIERPQNIIHQLKEEHPFNYQLMNDGLKLMLWGFFKKLVIADRLAIYVNLIFNYPWLHNGSSVVVASFFFAIQIYCDFSGYSDIAIGCARTMGIDLMRNFNRPYFAENIQEFWRRWHISLSTWFRDYLYFPMGGNRVPFGRLILNIMVVFIISGIWHGANYTFLIWGLLHGFFMLVYILLSPYLPKPSKNLFLRRIQRIVGIGITISLVCFSWIFFRANSLSDALVLIKNLKSIGEIPFRGGATSNFSHCILAILILFIVEFSMEYLPKKYQLYHSGNRFIRWGALTFTIVLILLLGVFNGGQFIYFQF